MNVEEKMVEKDQNKDVGYKTYIFFGSTMKLIH